MSSRLPILHAACLLALAACRTEDAGEAEFDPFEPATLEQGEALACGNGDTCTVTGDGAIYTATYRIGSTPTSHGELLQTITATATGVARSVTLPLRQLRAFHVPATVTNAAGQVGPAEPLLLHVGLYAANGASPGVPATFVSHGEVALTVANPDGSFDPARFSGVVTVPLTVDDPANPTIETGSAYGLAIWTDDLPPEATGTVLVGVGALVDADGTSYEGGAPFRRTTRRLQATGSWGASRYRSAGGWDVAVTLAVYTGPLLAITPPSATLAVGDTLAFGATGGLAPYAFELVSGTGSVAGTTYTTPATPGTATVRVRDTLGLESLSAVTTNAALALDAGATSLDAGASTTCVATGGVPPYTFSIASGPGTLDGAVYTAAGAGAVVLRVQDSAGHTQDAALTVVANAPAGLAYVPSSATCRVGFTCTIAAPGSTGGTIASYTIAPALPAGLSLDPATGAIGGTATVAIASTPFTITGTNSGGSTTAPFTLTVTEPRLGTASPQVVNQAGNPGTCVAVTFTNVGSEPVTGFLPPFTTGAYTNTGCAATTCTGTLAIGATCTVSIRGTGTTNGQALTGTVGVTASAGGTATADLSGTASIPSITAPATVNMDQFTQPGRCAGVTFTNTGSTAISGISAAVVTGDYTRGTCGGGCTANLNAGASCSVFIMGTRTSAGPLSGTVTLSHPTLGSTVVAVSGYASLTTSHVLAASYSNTPFLRLYDTRTFQDLSPGPTVLPSARATDVTFSPSGNLLAVSFQAAPWVWVYDTATWTKLPDLAVPPTNAGQGVAFSPNGQYLVVTQNNAPFLNIYETATWTRITGPTNLPTLGGTNEVKFSPDGSLLAVGLTNSPFVAVYNTSDWSRRPNLASSPGGAPTGLAFSPNGLWMGLTGTTGNFAIYATADWSRLPTVASAPAGGSEGIGFSNDSAMLAIGNSGGPATTTYDTGTWVKRAAYPGTSSGVSHDVAFSPDGVLVSFGTSTNATVAATYSMISNTRGVDTPFQSTGGNTTGLAYSPY